MPAWDAAEKIRVISLLLFSRPTDPKLSLRLDQPLRATRRQHKNTIFIQEAHPSSQYSPLTQSSGCPGWPEQQGPATRMISTRLRVLLLCLAVAMAAAGPPYLRRISLLQVGDEDELWCRQVGEGEHSVCTMFQANQSETGPAIHTNTTIIEGKDVCGSNARPCGDNCVNIGERSWIDSFLVAVSLPITPRNIPTCLCSTGSRCTCQAGHTCKAGYCCGREYSVCCDLSLGCTCY